MTKQEYESHFVPMVEQLTGDKEAFTIIETLATEMYQALQSDNQRNQIKIDFSEYDLLVGMMLGYLKAANNMADIMNGPIVLPKEMVDELMAKGIIDKSQVSELNDVNEMQEVLSHQELDDKKILH